jgi:hypothetical protein
MWTDEYTAFVHALEMMCVPHEFIKLTKHDCSWYGFPQSFMTGMQTVFVGGGTFVFNENGVFVVVGYGVENPSTDWRVRNEQKEQAR